MWWFHFLHLAGRSWAQVLTWRGTTTLSILLETIGPVATFVVTVRVTTGHWLPVFRNQARDLAKALVITVGVLSALTLIVFLVAVPMTVLRDHNDLVAANARLISETRKLRAEKEHAPQQSVNPDESNRAGARRDQHYELLRPVLRNESSQLKGVADQIKNTGHVSAMIETQAKTVPADLIWPDIMSQDLRNHFPDYDNKKRELRTQVEAQDREFQLTMSRLEDQKPVTDLEPYWKKMLAFALVERSLGHGDVMKLRVSEGGYNFESPRGTIGGSGQPPVDIVAAVRVFDSINADANLGPRIASMKRREEVIVNAAEDLSKQATFLAEGVVLPGMCRFLKKVD